MYDENGRIIGGVNMESQVSVKEKKEFLNWALKRHKLKRREAVWILSWLIKSEEVLSNIIFVDDVSKYDRGVIISTIMSESVPFRFYKGNLMTADAEKAFHDLRLHQDEKFYIQFEFPNKHQDDMYLSVLEDYNSSSEISPDTIEMVEEIAAELEKRNIMKAIDAALDSGDEKMFAELCEMLNGVGQKKTLSFSG